MTNGARDSLWLKPMKLRRNTWNSKLHPKAYKCYIVSNPGSRLTPQYADRGELKW